MMLNTSFLKRLKKRTIEWIKDNPLKITKGTVTDLSKGVVEMCLLTIFLYTRKTLNISFGEEFFKKGDKVKLLLIHFYAKNTHYNTIIMEERANPFWRMIYTKYRILRSFLLGTIFFIEGKITLLQRFLKMIFWDPKNYCLNHLWVL